MLPRHFIETARSTKDGKFAENSKFASLDCRFGEEEVINVERVIVVHQIDKVLSIYNMRFTRRLGPDPHASGAQTPALYGCADILELETGDFAVIGRDITDAAAGQLPPRTSCGPDERIVVIPRRILIGAKPDIPDKS